MRAMLGVSGLVAVGALATGSDAPLVYWLGPVLLAQPVLRLILLVEHTGCPATASALTNTRTTLTLWPVRLAMWNMPFPAHHHLYPPTPFPPPPPPPPPAPPPPP